MSECSSFCPYRKYGCLEESKMSMEILQTHREVYKTLHNNLLLKSLDEKISKEFLRKTHELNEMIPNSSKFLKNIV
jgi:hypothetical protein